MSNDSADSQKTPSPLAGEGGDGGYRSVENAPLAPPLSRQGRGDSRGKGPVVQAEVQPSAAKVGDLITLSIKVSHPPGLVIEPPAFQKSLGAFEVYASSPLAVQQSGAKETQRFAVQLQNFTTGQQTLPGLELTYRDEKGKEHSLKTPELQVVIQEIPAGPKDKGDIRGIKGVVGPVAWSPWWWVLLGLAVAGGAVWLWRKRQKELQGSPPPPPVPADETALKKLRELRTAGWAETGRIKEFYSALSDILRSYLENGFHCPALERTTNELIRDLRNRSVFSPERLMALKELLEACDLVKFAKFRPHVMEAFNDHMQAVQFVEQTRTMLSQKSPPFQGEGEG